MFNWLQLISFNFEFHLFIIDWVYIPSGSVDGFFVVFNQQINWNFCIFILFFPPSSPASPSQCGGQPRLRAEQRQGPAGAGQGRSDPPRHTEDHVLRLNAAPPSPLPSSCRAQPTAPLQLLVSRQDGGSVQDVKDAERSGGCFMQTVTAGRLPSHQLAPPSPACVSSHCM